MEPHTKTIARRFYDAVSSGDPAADLEEICSPDLRGHAGAGATLSDLEESLGAFVTAFPDLQVDIRHLVAEGDTVSTWVTYSGTHRAPFAGVEATGAQVRFAAWDLLRVEGDRIVEITQYCDLFTLMNQMGALPTATPA
jgi:predicted ester cyclase